MLSSCLLTRGYLCATHAQRPSRPPIPFTPAAVALGAATGAALGAATGAPLYRHARPHLLRANDAGARAREHVGAHYRHAKPRLLKAVGLLGLLAMARV
jgi:hypothetical protein